MTPHPTGSGRRAGFTNLGPPFQTISDSLQIESLVILFLSSLESLRDIVSEVDKRVESVASAVFQVVNPASCQKAILYIVVRRHCF